MADQDRCCPHADTAAGEEDEYWELKDEYWEIYPITYVSDESLGTATSSKPQEADRGTKHEFSGHITQELSPPIVTSESTREKEIAAKSSLPRSFVFNKAWAMDIVGNSEWVQREKGAASLLESAIEEVARSIPEDWRLPGQTNFWSRTMHTRGRGGHFLWHLGTVEGWDLMHGSLKWHPQKYSSNVASRGHWDRMVIHLHTAATVVGSMIACDDPLNPRPQADVQDLTTVCRRLRPIIESQLYPLGASAFQTKVTFCIQPEGTSSEFNWLQTRRKQLKGWVQRLQSQLRSETSDLKRGSLHGK